MSEKKSQKQNNKNDKKKRVSIVKIFLVTIILIGFIGAGATAGMVMSVVKTAEPIDASNIYEMLDQSSFILDSEGQVIEQIQSNNFRVVIDYAEMPKHLRDAFVAIEDERFWTHKGIDIKRILGAFWINLRTGSQQGASTINQQLAINLYLNRSDKRYTRKIKDAYYGILLNKQLSKAQILEAYLNTIYLGSSAYGVQAASQVYFSKDAKDLTIAESALIAGITRHPSKNSPIITLEKADVKEHHVILDDSDPVYTVVVNEKIDEYVIKRQKLVLNSMKRLGFITDTQYNQALQEDVKSSLKPNRLVARDISSYFGDLVKRDVIKAFEDHGYSSDEANNMLYSGGLKINSTLNTRIQKILEEEYANSNNFPKIKSSDKTALLKKEGFSEDEQKNLIDDKGQIQPQSAMVISDPQTGEIKAIIGGRMTSGQKIFNRALSPRQPGSSIKPIAVYTPAIDHGFTTSNVVDDIPGYFNKSTPGKPWPKNLYLSGGYRGLITLREALERSSNLVAVKLGSMLAGNENNSINTMLDYMKKMGISTIHTRETPLVVNGKRYTDEALPTALGGMTRGVSPLEMDAAFNVLANNGLYTKPITFTSIYDRHDNLILENTPEQHRVVTPQVAYVMTDMLRGVVTSSRGTGGGAAIGNIPVAGKTGTTDDRKDAWFIGYTPYYSASLWIGSDQPVSLSTGSSAAATLWGKVMKRVHEGLAFKDFEMPGDIVKVNVCTISGKIPTEACALDPRGSTVRTEIFIKGTEPKEECDCHVFADIHTPSGKLATDLTPPWLTESKVFVKRPIPYYPSENGGITPLDYIYEMPYEYYDPLVDGFGAPFPSWPTNGEGTDNGYNEYENDNIIESENDY
ncbi:MAG TPA: PBP1A family penicillin-binding protein [Clostridia bacterium]|nr:PBP1A family penicillin-binding protein [Clostridia bacterium]